jgi:hypothetical protein
MIPTSYQWEKNLKTYNFFGMGLCVALSFNPKLFIGLGYQGKDIVFRYVTKYSSLRDFGP